MIGSYLEQSFKLFAAHQRDARERGKGDGDALQAMASLAQKNYQRWRSVQEEISARSSTPPTAAGATPRARMVRGKRARPDERRAVRRCG